MFNTETIFRVHKNKNYTTMCNLHFDDRRLSLKPSAFTLSFYQSQTIGKLLFKISLILIQTGGKASIPGYGN